MVGSSVSCCAYRSFAAASTAKNIWAYHTVSSVLLECYATLHVSVLVSFVKIGWDTNSSLCGPSRRNISGRWNRYEWLQSWLPTWRWSPTVWQTLWSKLCSCRLVCLTAVHAELSLAGGVLYPHTLIEQAAHPPQNGQPTPQAMRAQHHSEEWGLLACFAGLWTKLPWLCIQCSKLGGFWVDELSGRASMRDNTGSVLNASRNFRQTNHRRKNLACVLKHSLCFDIFTMINKVVMQWTLLCNLQNMQWLYICLNVTFSTFSTPWYNIALVCTSLHPWGLPMPYNPKSGIVAECHDCTANYFIHCKLCMHQLFFHCSFSSCTVLSGTII